MKKIQSPRRGLALMMSLIVAMLLVVLVGAFITVNRSNNAITGNVVARQNAYNACLSGLSFAWAQLEQDQNWGFEGFPTGTNNLSYPISAPKVRIRIHGDQDEPDNPDLNFIEGEIVGSSDRFEIRLINNLKNRHVERSTFLGDIPGRTARLEILGNSNGIGLKLQSVLRKTPYVDSSALSSKNMGVELLADSTQAWNLRSKDPYVNQVRSNNDILGPSAVNGNLKFRDPPRGGVAMAKNDIKLDGQSVMNNPALLQQSQIASKGSFQMGTPEVDVPDLTRQNLDFPPVTVSVPEGEMGLRIVEHHEWIEEADPVSGEMRWRQVVTGHNAIEHDDKIWIAATSEPISDSGLVYDQRGGPDGFQNVPYQPQPGELEDYPVLYEADENHKMAANLLTGEITMSAGTSFEVEGDLNIVQNEDAPQAHLKFAYELEPDGFTRFTGGEMGTAAMDNPSANSAALTTTGNLFIDGITTGFGSLYADAEVELRAKSGLRADLDLAVAVHGYEIDFLAEEPPENSVPNTHLAADFEVYQDALGPNYSTYEDYWAAEQSRRSVIGLDPNMPSVGIRNKTLDNGAAYYWDLLKEDLELGDPPDFSSPPFGSEWSGDITLDEYIRLREYARNDSTSWLNSSSQTYNNVTSSIDTNISLFSGWAHRMDMKMEDYMVENIALIADVYFVGLVHAGEGGFRAHANRSSMLIEGAVVSKGDLIIQDAPAVDFVYNRLYLDDVVRQFFGESISLDQVYYKIQ